MKIIGRCSDPLPFGNVCKLRQRSSRLLRQHNHDLISLLTGLLAAATLCLSCGELCRKFHPFERMMVPSVRHAGLVKRKNRFRRLGLTVVGAEKVTNDELINLWTSGWVIQLVTSPHVVSFLPQTPRLIATVISAGFRSALSTT